MYIRVCTFFWSSSMKGNANQLTLKKVVERTDGRTGGWVDLYRLFLCFLLMWIVKHTNCIVLLPLSYSFPLPLPRTFCLFVCVDWSSMQVVAPIKASHEDAIHDVAYDYYGRRIASCSSDHKIKVWDKNPETGEWVCTAEWKAHPAPVWKLVWSHPEYGQLLASCSFDRTVVIWEDRGPKAIAQGHGAAVGRSAQFQMKGSRLDFNQAVNDIAFSPRHVGLQLAVATDDGFVTVYEFIDVMDMTQPRISKFQAPQSSVSQDGPTGATSIAWSSARFCVPMLVVGANDGGVAVWGYSDTFRKWQRLFDLGLGGQGGHDSTVHDVVWAPDIGRSSHVLATCSKDKTVRIWMIEKELTNPTTQSEPKSRIIPVAQVLSEHNAEVWRVQFNVTGTTLASSGDDGLVRVWKQNLKNQWVEDGTIAGEKYESKKKGSDKGAPTI